MKISAGAILLALLLVSGCAPTWVRVDDAGRNYSTEHYSVTLPSGWLRLESDDTLFLSRDGILLQIISIQFRPHENTFEKIEKDSSATMLPSELAQLTIAELKASQDDGLPSLEILRNAPVELAGHTGFDIHLRYKTNDGLRRDMEMRGVVDDSGYYLLKYSAPTLHYFERDRQTYMTLTESLQL
ncbi:MAG: hypothetical protein PVH38_12030 [Gammaproteobacteria bacterium]